MATRGYFFIGVKMAQKRMFCKTITNSARFLKMPHESQNLYFHLGMNADDDGIVEAFSIMRAVGSNDDNLRVLVSKGFVKILNEDLVSFIVDWNEHNLIRADRKVNSIYQKLLLQVDPNSKIIIPKPRADTGKMACQPDLNEYLDNGRPLDGIGKVRLGKVSIEEDVYYKNEYFSISFNKHIEYKDIYKNIDIDTEYKKMKIWLDDNPSRRKTVKGYPKFISNWLSSAKPQIKNDYISDDEKRRQDDERKRIAFEKQLDEQKKNAMTKEELKEFWNV
jgi:hypothetical protein